MRNISDVIENYLKKVIESSNSDVVELKRSEIADRFECVPSQINYVINTRFTLEKGYLVESKRGGGGYIRIIRLKPKSNQELIKEMDLVAEHPLPQQAAFDLVERLKEENLITEREKRLMFKVLHRDILDIPLPKRDQVRSKIFKELLTTIKMYG
ncbi:CtsR family transcriptional regulator [Alkalibacillus haloalkaliphilus]|uniref:Transcriptional regulator CtsR n=1 Tax=Alkalibacillus haloalkaliphilus TaxID=94136 RepID=A0A511W759_9BACI|nr:CtsR family transcriptional regulator [Alkalibacillus haloalkaliphilus]MDV2582701.1 CtsR family transcriptional regulator [Alkalibacillus haloalkaliphilus]GEN46876.1 transcriptional regulator [Alkalibacillus haloalkaliphilus]